jgi:hypothetical protein
MLSKKAKTFPPSGRIYFTKRRIFWLGALILAPSSEDSLRPCHLIQKWQNRPARQSCQIGREIPCQDTTPGALQGAATYSPGN